MGARHMQQIACDCTEPLEAAPHQLMFSKTMCGKCRGVIPELVMPSVSVVIPHAGGSQQCHAKSIFALPVIPSLPFNIPFAAFSLHKVCFMRSKVVCSNINILGTYRELST